jgi:hypothetical protein
MTVLCPHCRFLCEDTDTHCYFCGEAISGGKPDGAP